MSGNLIYETNPELARIPTKVERKEVPITATVQVRATELLAAGWSRITRVEFAFSIGIVAPANTKSTGRLYLRNATIANLGPWNVASGSAYGQHTVVYDIELMTVAARLAEGGDVWLVELTNDETLAGVAGLFDYITVYGD